MKSLKLPVLAIAAISFVSTAASNPARAEGLYLGAGVYYSDSDVGDDTVPAGFIGYTFVDTNFLMLAVEGGYYDLGDSSDRFEKLKADAWTAGGMASLPLGPFFELYAKGGVAFLNTELKQEGRNDKNSDEEAYYGAGVAIDILDTIDLYAEYIWFDTDYNSEVAGVGIRLAF